MPGQHLRAGGFLQPALQMPELDPTCVIDLLPPEEKPYTVILLPYPDRQTDEPLRYRERRLLTRLANDWDV